MELLAAAMAAPIVVPVVTELPRFLEGLMALLILEARWMPLLLGSANSGRAEEVGLRSPLGVSLRDLGRLVGSSEPKSVV